MITENPAKALKLQNYGIQVGNKADVVLLDTKVKADAIIDLPERNYVIKDGRITVEVKKEVKIFR